MSRGDPFGIVGRVVDGRYRIETVAGVGGFGVVYKAHHLGFDAPIAIKVLKLPEPWSPERKRRRIDDFRREGKVLFELSRLHPSIVRAFETGAVTLMDGSLAPYLALEWLEGVSLERELRYRRMLGAVPMPRMQALHLLQAPAAALACAHERGFIHRDIKPGNLFASVEAGKLEVKVLDFGLAMQKMVDESRDSRPIGEFGASFTPQYASPEQWHPTLGATGKWTDVHAMALVYIEFITGTPPFGGRAATEIRTACLDPTTRSTPALLNLPSTPESEVVLRRALAVDPRDRYQDISTFWADLCSAEGWSPGGGCAPEVLSLASREADQAGESGETRSVRSTIRTEVREKASTTAELRTVGNGTVSQRRRAGWQAPAALAVVCGFVVFLIAGIGSRLARSSGAGPGPGAGATQTGFVLQEMPRSLQPGWKPASFDGANVLVDRAIKSPPPRESTNVRTSRRNREVVSTAGSTRGHRESARPKLDPVVAPPPSSAIDHLLHQQELALRR